MISAMIYLWHSKCYITLNIYSIMSHIKIDVSHYIYIPYRTRRYCTETCIINGVTIPKNSYVYIAIHPLHYSPEFWDKPEEFRPERLEGVKSMIKNANTTTHRFSPEEKEDRHPMCYMPFGWGPRNCLGMRFAQVEAKMALTAMLRKFKFVKTPETEVSDS